MALKDLTFPTATIKTSGGEFTLRGLNTADIVSLFREFDQEIMAMANGSASGELDAANLGQRLLSEAPKLAATIIAVAANEPESIDTVSRLPFGVQFSALTQAAELTFAMEGGIQNFMATVKRVIAGMSQMQLNTRN